MDDPTIEAAARAMHDVFHDDQPDYGLCTNDCVTADSVWLEAARAALSAAREADPTIEAAAAKKGNDMEIVETFDGSGDAFLRHRGEQVLCITSDTPVYVNGVMVDTPLGDRESDPAVEAADTRDVVISREDWNWLIDDHARLERVEQAAKGCACTCDIECGQSLLDGHPMTAKSQCPRGRLSAALSAAKRRRPQGTG